MASNCKFTCQGNKEILMSYLKCVRSKYYMQNHFEMNLIKFLNYGTWIFEVFGSIEKLITDNKIFHWITFPVSTAESFICYFSR